MLRFILFSLFFGIAVVGATWAIWGLETALGGACTFAACCLGMLLFLGLDQFLIPFPPEYRMYGFLLGVAVRGGIPVIFLVALICFFRESISPAFLNGGVYSFFVDYPFLLAGAVWCMLSRTPWHKEIDVINNTK